jgi:hypothetical protein
MTNQITALTIVRTLPDYAETNQFGAMRMSCRIEGKLYTGQQFYDLGSRIKPYAALEMAAEKMLAEITAA